MPKIIVKQTFRMCVGTDVHATEFTPAEEAIEVNARVAEVACEEGWAVPFEEPTEPETPEETEEPTEPETDGPTGEAEPSASSPQAQASTAATSPESKPRGSKGGRR